MDNSTLATMALQLLPQTGDSAYWRLIKAFDTPEAAIEQSTATLEAYLPSTAVEQLTDYRQRRWQSALGQRLQRDLDWLQAANIRVITFGDDDYPQLLAEIDQPPPLLYLQGDAACLHLPQIAVVGSRHPTRHGKEVASEFCRYLSRAGFTITSGMALGIDGIAHRGALVEKGRTIAVLGTGIDILYPRRHRQLAGDILTGQGAVISEFPPQTPALSTNFPRRNRIISGLSLGVLVVEAALKSGSLISARFAMQQNREVFAVPGSIYNPLSRGCHSLIREGATLVEQAQDILDQLQGMLGYKYQELKGLNSRAGSSVNNGNAGPDISTLTEPERQVLAGLDFQQPTSVDSLVMSSGIEVDIIAASLITLELAGLVCQTAAGYQRLK